LSVEIVNALLTSTENLEAIRKAATILVIEIAQVLAAEMDTGVRLAATVVNVERRRPQRY
jgi:hypothetical protein